MMHSPMLADNFTESPPGQHKLLTMNSLCNSTKGNLPTGTPQSAHQRKISRSRTYPLSPPCLLKPKKQRRPTAVASHDRGNDTFIQSLLFPEIPVNAPEVENVNVVVPRVKLRPKRNNKFPSLYPRIIPIPILIDGPTPEKPKDKLPSIWLQPRKGKKSNIAKENDEFSAMVVG